MLNIKKLYTMVASDDQGNRLKSEDKIHQNLSDLDNSYKYGRIARVILIT